MARTFDTDLSGKIVLVTGASVGIGKEIARNLAGMKARVVMACRNAERGEAARAEIEKETGNRTLEVMLVDLSSQSSIRACARAFASKHPKLDVLVNNAGGWQSDRAVTKDGYELTWGTNVLAYHLLAQLLLPSLKASGKGRIVNVASTMAYGLDFDDLNYEKRKWDPFTAYAQSKQANRMLTWALAEKLAGSGVTANAAHPGWISSEFNRNAKGFMGTVVFTMTRLFAGSTKKGADTPSWLASAPELDGKTGGFFHARKEHTCKFREMAACRRLWDIVEGMTSETRAAA